MKPSLVLAIAAGRGVPPDHRVVTADRDGQLAIGADVQALTVTIDLWDNRDNHASQTYTLVR